MSSSGEDHAAASETLDIVSEISDILNTGLDRESLGILITMCENGVNPEALAAVVKELRREAAALKASNPVPPQPEGIKKAGSSQD